MKSEIHRTLPEAEIVQRVPRLLVECRRLFKHRPEWGSWKGLEFGNRWRRLYSASSRPVLLTRDCLYCTRNSS